MEHIHKQGKYSPEMLSDKNVSELINATSSVLSEKLDSLSVKQEIPDDLAATLRKNIFYFSGFKTHHELEEASRMLQSDDGGFKPFSKFYEDVKAIDATYNRNYLQAEYNFATASTQMAVKWKEWERTADRYDLQYRTAGDDRVREEHRELEGITLPMTDPFWNEYYPPNGWNCRCNAVRVRKGKYPTSDSDEAIQKGKNCTSKPKQQIFRFNPGKQEKIFPPKHPYFPKRCGNCDRKNIMQLSTPIDKKLPQCVACGELFKQCNKQSLESIKLWKEKHLPKENSTIDVFGDNISSGSILITRGSINKTVSHTQNLAVRNVINDIENSIKKWEYVGWLECKTDKKTGKTKHPEAEYFTYYKMEIGGKTYYANVKAQQSYGREHLYCIREHLDIQNLHKDTPPNIDKYKK